MVDNFGSIYMFRILIISSGIVFLTGYMNWFGEKKKGYSHMDVTTSSYNSDDVAAPSPNSDCDPPEELVTCCCGQVTASKVFIEKHSELVLLSFLVSGLAIAVSVCMMSIQEWHPRLMIILFVVFSVSTLFYVVTMRCNLPEVGKAGLFIFLSNLSTPDIESAMFYWFTNSPEGPRFSPQFIGYISGIAYFAMFIGMIYHLQFLILYVTSYCRNFTI